MDTSVLRIAIVPGVTPGKWVRVWEQRHPEVRIELVLVEEVEQTVVLHDGRADMALVRLPADREGLHLIPLYREVAVAVLPKEHPFAEEPELALADLAEEHLLQEPDEVPGWAEVADEVRDGTRLDLRAMSLREAVEVVASGTGFLVVPMSVARLHHRKDVVAVPLPELPGTQVGLAWRADVEDPRLEDFVGVVRGRTARSSRGADSPSAPDKAARKASKPATPARKSATSPRGAKGARGRTPRKGGPRKRG